MNNKIKMLIGCSMLTASWVCLAEAPVEEAGTEYENGSLQGAAASTAGIPVVDSTYQLAETTEDKKTESHDTEQAAQEPSSAASSPQVAATQQTPTEQRLGRIEKQVNNMANMNFPQQITSLQQQIAQLRGQLEVQGHDLQLLNKQVRSFYSDLDNRINQLNNLTSGNTSTQVVTKKDSHTAPAPTNIQLQDANTYQEAFSFLTNRQYVKSIRAFTNYINDYPNGQYISDANYWLGELYLITNDSKKAAQQFNTVISKYPKTTKASDAKLKLAIIHANSGKKDQARRELQNIKKQHPDSTAAQLANIRLQQMEQESEN